MNASPWRLLIDPPAAGAWNMAVDEAILRRCVDAVQQGEPPPPPTLRLYGWQPGALSLGANQVPVLDTDYLRREGLGLVRRPTGGLTVLHENECTYSISGALRSVSFPGAVLDTYLRIAEALVAALKRLDVTAEISGRTDAVHPRAGSAGDLGSAACFGSTSSYEIRVHDQKLIGSAQLRRRGAFLQHGSIPLWADSQRLAAAIGGDVGEASYALADVVPAPVNADRLTGALVEAFAERFQTSLQPGELTTAEHEDATRLYSWKYLSGAWTWHGTRPVIPQAGPRPTSGCEAD